MSVPWKETTPPPHFADLPTLKVCPCDSGVDPFLKVLRQVIRYLKFFLLKWQQNMAAHLALNSYRDFYADIE